MATLLRARVTLAWSSGGPGVCTYYFSQGSLGPDNWAGVAESARGDLGDVWGNFNDSLVSGMTWTVEPTVDLIDVETGNITDQFDDTSDTYTGTGANTSKNMSRAQQIYLRFRTSDFFDGRRLAGGTFMGPVGADIAGSDGRISSGAQETYEGYWAAPISGLGARLAVFAPPLPARPGAHGTLPARDGRYGDVTTVRCMGVPGTLRSRRD